MSSCTRKMYGGGEREQIRKQLRAKEMILAKLKITPGVTNNQIRAATKNVANYKQQYQNKYIPFSYDMKSFQGIY